MKDFIKNVTLGILLFAVVIFYTKDNVRPPLLGSFIPRVEITEDKLQVVSINPENLWTTEEAMVQYLPEQKTVLITGPIETSTLANFKKFLNNDIETVAIASPGGDLATSIEIALITRDRKYNTLIPIGSMCYSGCSLIFQAGIKRSAYSNSMLMYHSAKYVDPKTKQDKISESGTAVYWGNLIALGTNGNLFGLMDDLRTDYYISAKNSIKYNIVTDLIELDSSKNITYS